MTDILMSHRHDSTDSRIEKANRFETSLPEPKRTESLDFRTRSPHRADSHALSLLPIITILASSLYSFPTLSFISLTNPQNVSIEAFFRWGWIEDLSLQFSNLFKAHINSTDSPKLRALSLSPNSLILRETSFIADR